LGSVVELKKTGSSPGSGVVSPAFIETLGGLCGRVVDLSNLSEEYFLSTGTKIQEYSESSARITDMALAASRIMSGDEIRNAVKGLEGMVDQLGNLFQRMTSVSNKHMETLRSIACSVRSVEKELMGLGDTARDLKMLSLSTKIQSTRTGVGSSAFMHLGHDIGRLSVTISSKALGLLSETKTLSHFLHDVHSTLHDLKDKQDFQTVGVMKGAHSIIESMTDLRSKSMEEAERIRQASQEISLGVSDMVTAVQYQDITRQSHDKVIQNLNMILSERWGEGSHDNDPAFPPSHVSPEIFITGHCLKQIDRIERTDLLTQDALAGLIRSMEGIAGNIEKMSGITRAANRDSTRFLNDLESAMSSVTSFLKEVVQSSREMSGSMNSLAHTVEGMAEFIGDIEEMSSEVELISLNALIMSAQTGLDGAGMGVIAQAVQATASDSDGQRRSVVGKLNEIKESSSELKAEIEATSQSEEVKPDQLVRELGVFLEALRTMQEKIVSMLHEIEKQSGQLIIAIHSSIDEIRDHIRLEKSSGEIASDLKILTLNCSGAIKPADLMMITGDRFSREDLQVMGHQQRVELVEEYFEKHLPEDQAGDSRTSSSLEGEVLLFGDDQEREQ